MHTGKNMIVALAALTTAIAVPAKAQAPTDVAACPALRWTTLGTAGGPVPTMDRAEPANLLTAGSANILVDTGDGTVDELARLGMDIGQISAVFISHPHLDHTGGLSAVIGLRWMNHFPGVLTVYVPEGSRALVDGVVAALQPQSEIGFGLGEAGTPPASSVRVVEVKSGDVLKLGDLTVRAAENSHFSHPGPKKPNEPISLSYRFTLGNRSITFTGDTGPSDAVTKLASGSDMLVSEVVDLDPILKAIRKRRPDTDPELFAHMQMHLSTHHLQPDAVGEMAAAAGVGHVVLTHFAIPPTPLSQSEQDLRSGVRRHFRGPLDLARDLASYDVGCSGN